MRSAEKGQEPHKSEVVSGQEADQAAQGLLVSLLEEDIDEDMNCSFSPKRYPSSSQAAKQGVV